MQRLKEKVSKRSRATIISASPEVQSTSRHLDSSHSTSKEQSPPAGGTNSQWNQDSQTRQYTAGPTFSNPRASLPTVSPAAARIEPAAGTTTAQLTAPSGVESSDQGPSATGSVDSYWHPYQSSSYTKAQSQQQKRNQHQDEWPPLLSKLRLESMDTSGGILALSQQKVQDLRPRNSDEAGLQQTGTQKMRKSISPQELMLDEYDIDKSDMAFPFHGELQRISTTQRQPSNMARYYMPHSHREPFIPQQYPFIDQRSRSKSQSTLPDSLCDFPAHMLSMESKVEESASMPSSQQSVHKLRTQLQQTLLQFQRSTIPSPQTPGSSKLRRSPSISSMTSVHSEVSEHDSHGNVTKRTVTTTTTTHYSVSATDDSASDRGYDHISRILPSSRPRPPKGSAYRSSASRSMVRSISSLMKLKKPLKCKICHKRFTRRRSLRAHMRSHDGETLFECDGEGCRKWFRAASDYLEHREVHKLQSRDSDADVEM